MPPSSPKLKLPRVEHVALRRFSLYAANPNAEFDCGDGVLCLVGANGIGKSTLLAAINFCLTGVVVDPNRTFESMEEYYKFTRSYSGSYFRGRIIANDEDEAEITLRFVIGNHRYELRRGMFEPDELRDLSIIEIDSGYAVDLKEDPTRGERHREYADNLVAHSGLSTFEEFAFLQHFVFTFDEQRRTLFWNQRVLERALYRAFGLEPDMAKKVDSLRREIQQADSQVRNSQWEATRMRKRINDIRSKAQAVAGAQQTYETLVADHETLTNQFEEQSELVRKIEDSINDANLRLADASVRETSLRDEYARFFDVRFNQRPPLEHHPLVVRSLKEHACALCGNDTKTALNTLSRRAQAHTCPLCEAKLPEKRANPDDAARLELIDRELMEMKKSLQGVHKTLHKLRNEQNTARQNFEATKTKLDEFDQQNTATLEALRLLLDHGISGASLADYREQLAAMDREKKIAYNKREELKRQLLTLQRALEREYLAAETTFVPRFAGLAHHFLGMPLSVQMEANTARGLDLVVTVRGTTRREQQHLSESQRFFLDIALRMALTQHMSDSTSPGAMIIDTPEGSLDIAYEKRAGEMLAMFAESGHQILMTANLNSSQMLLALARRSASARMRLCRMTDWAELSEVQEEEEGLFVEAYQKLEKAMVTPPQPT
jgi:DNA repair exonuclease SbcCD ATPase subunit